jgi:TPR repeat protein
MQIQCLDFKRVHDYWLPLAEAGDAKIMSALGELYMRGRGVGQDPHKAVYWFERAIEAGYLPAHLHLVKMYTGNRGLPPDPVKKIHHLRKGVEAGRWDAMVDLANHLIEGLHVEKNPEEAFAIAIRCAEEGGEEARRIIGKLYAEGLGVSKSLPDAVYWLRIATDDGDHRAEIMLDGILKTGSLPTPDHYPRSFAEILKLAEAGRPAACYETGVFYIRGQGTPRNEAEGARWILRAAELGVARAQWHIADILEAGRYVPRDPEAAARWREIHRATLADLPHIPANDSETLFLANSDPSVP